MTFNKTSSLFSVFKWGVILIILVTPLLVINLFLYPTNFSKTIFFRISVEILFIFYLFSVITEKKHNLSFSPIIISAIVFFCILIFTSLLGVNFSRSFWGTPQRMEGLVTLVHVFGFFLILISVFRDSHIYLKFFKISLISSSMVSFVTILFVFLFYIGRIEKLEPKLETYFGNLAYLGLYLLLNVFLALVVFFEERRSKYRWLYIIVFALNLLALFFSGARTALGAVLVGLFCFFIFYLLFSKLSRKKKLIIIIGIVFLILLALLFLFFIKEKIKDEPWVQRTPFLSKIVSVSFETTTFRNRLMAWQFGFQGWKEKKILGWGKENFNIAYTKYFTPAILSYVSEHFDRAHNKFIDILVENGIVGLFSYIFLISAVFYTLWKNLKAKRVNFLTGGILFAFLISYLFQLFFLFDTLNSYILFFLVISFVEAKSHAGLQKEHRKPSRNHFQREKLLLTLLLTISIAIFFYRANILSAISNYYARKALNIQTLHRQEQRSPSASAYLIPKEKYFEIVDYFKKSLKFSNYYNYKNLRIKFAEFIVSIANNLINDTIINDLKYISQELQDNIEETPDLYDYETYLFLGGIYNLLGKTDEAYFKIAEDFLQKGLEVNSSDPKFYIQLAENKFLQDEPEKMTEFYNQAIDLNEDLAWVYWDFGTFYLKMDEKDKAIVELEKAMVVERELIQKSSERGGVLYTPNTSNLTLLFSLYLEKEDYQKLISLYQEILDIYERILPRASKGFKSYYIQLYTSLAATYAEIGENDKAREVTLQILNLDPEIIEVDPNTQDQAQRFLEQLGE